MNTLVITSLVISIILLVYFRKEPFKILEESQQDEIDNHYRPLVFKSEKKMKPNKELQETLLALLRTVNINGPPGGANVSFEQNKYDLIFKDILISSEKRDSSKYPNPNNYTIKLNVNLNKIYKAELIEVYVPAATDDIVNIPITANRLYFTYINGCKVTSAYVKIQPGTYLNPASIASELTRQINAVLFFAGFELSECVGITITYDSDLNRYIFRDRAFASENTFLIYPENGYIIRPDIIVQDSICECMMLLSKEPYYSGPKCVRSDPNGNLYVDTATNYGEYTDHCGQFKSVPSSADTHFSNCIMSDVVLTSCKLYLSLGKLDGDTCNIVGHQDPTYSKGSVSTVFCQIPNNTIVSSKAVKTLLNQPGSYSSIQFYNPPVHRLNRLEIKWYNEEGQLVRILDHCFTLRVYYFQKRIDTTDFSYSV
jgi:hypothetical protein